MANTYTLIETKTLTSDVSGVSFTSIPSTYDDLVFVGSLRITGGSGVHYMRFNNITTNDYTTRILAGRGSTGYSEYAEGTNYIKPAGSATIGGSVAYNGTYTDTYSNFEFYIPGYTRTDLFKSFHHVASIANNNAIWDVQMVGGVLNNSSVVDRVDFINFSGGESFVSKSSISLYGIKNS
jgi:hypothetical protein